MLVSIYDIVVSQFFPQKGLPTISTWLPTWNWWAWVILLLIVIIIAIVEGSYRLHSKPPLASVIKQDYSILWADRETYGIKANNLTLVGHIKINAMSKITITSLELDIESSFVKPKEEWTDETFYGSEYPTFQQEFDIPANIPRGKRVGKISAIVNGERYISEPFTLDLPQGHNLGDSP